MRLRRRKQQPIFSTLSTLTKEEPLKPKVEPKNELETKPETSHTEPSFGKEKPVAHPANRLIHDPFAATDFIYISPGTYLRGSPEEEIGRRADEMLHEVTLTQGFQLQITLVTQVQWKTVMGKNPSSFAGSQLNRPVDSVSWNDCQLFIKRLNSLGHYQYRLPTEAEWEYACRAAALTPFSGGDASCSENDCADALEDLGWYIANSSGKTQPVGRKKPNAWGLYDMHGNLCEWCEDWYGSYSDAPLIDPLNDVRASGRVCRGGCWISTAHNCRSACRFSWDPDCRSDFIGFRLVREERAPIGS